MGRCCTLLLYRRTDGDGVAGHLVLTRPNMVGVTGFEPATSSSRRSFRTLRAGLVERRSRPESSTHVC